jgi:RNA polymerase sigma-70 factor (ECF subfamily)
MREFGIKPWLLRILHNTFLNRQAREGRAPKSADPATLEQASEARGGSEEAPPELDYDHLDGEVKQAVLELSEEFRTVLLLWATRELSYQEIAEALGIPIGTVMSRLHRARQQLVRNLGDYARANRLTTGSDEP